MVLTKQQNGERILCKEGMHKDEDVKDNHESSSAILEMSLHTTCM